jgi:hypothetical protein
MQRLGWACLYGAVLAAVWVLLAWWNDATLHFAPLLVSAVVPLGVALAGKPPSFSGLAAAAGAGTMLALATTLGLALTGHLAGSSLLPAGGAAAEAVAFSLAGGVLGLVLGRARRSGK